MIKSIKATSRVVCGTLKNIAMAEVRQCLCLKGNWSRLLAVFLSNPENHYKEMAALSGWSVNSGSDRSSASVTSIKFTRPH